MTQSVQTTSGLPSHAMQLGVVTFNGRRYLAVLYYQDAEGAPLPIRDNMKQAQEVYCNVLQKMLDEVGRKGKDFPKRDFSIAEISSAGFTFAGVEEEEDEEISSLSHVTLKTDKQWGVFLFLLEQPQHAPAVQNHIKLLDITKFTPQKMMQLMASIDKKYKSLSSSQTQQQSNPFNDEEKELLELLRCFKLSQGTKDAEEYLAFTMCRANLAIQANK